MLIWQSLLDRSSALGQVLDQCLQIVYVDKVTSKKHGLGWGSGIQMATMKQNIGLYRMLLVHIGTIWTSTYLYLRCIIVHFKPTWYKPTNWFLFHYFIGLVHTTYTQQYNQCNNMSSKDFNFSHASGNRPIFYNTQTM